MAYAAMRKAGLVPEAAPDLRTVALYVRVSTGYQVDKDSLPFQKKELKNYCEHVLRIDKNRIEIFEDAGKSGKNTNRPGFERMMKKVRAGQISHVIVYKIDRISRNLVDFSLMYDDFKYNRVTFISLNEQFDTSSAIGEAVLKIILVFAELERKLTSERVKDVMIGRALSGQWNGARVPFGWDWDEESKFPKHSETEAVFARLMYDLYEETRSTCKVRDYCNAHDVPTKRGGEWTSKTVADFIRNPMNRGDYRYNYRESARGRKKPEEEVVYIEGVFPPLVPVEQWDRCSAIMDHNAAVRCTPGVPHKKKHVHPFAGLLVCGACGAPYQVIKQDKPRENGFSPSLYRCGNRYRKRSCTAAGCSDVVIGPFVFNYISSMVRAANLRTKIKAPEELERLLLSGPEFQNVAGIASEGLNATFALLSGRPAASGPSYAPDLLTAPAGSVNAGEVEEIRQQITRLERAAERLKKAYLFDENAMSEKEYLETKIALDTERVQAENRLKDLSEATFSTDAGELSFIKSASSFLLAHRIQSGDHIVYSDFAPLVGNETMRDFLNLIIEKIVIRNGRPEEITFKNGLTHIFLYRDETSENVAKS